MIMTVVSSCATPRASVPTDSLSQSFWEIHATFGTPRLMQRNRRGVRARKIPDPRVANGEPQGLGAFEQRHRANQAHTPCFSIKICQLLAQPLAKILFSRGAKGCIMFQ